jgi:hypothetical protein
VRWHGYAIAEDIRNIGFGKFATVTASQRSQIGRYPVWIREGTASLQIIAVANGTILLVQVSTGGSSA